jgi:uncharacterized RDD family membrane protein YckC
VTRAPSPQPDRDLTAPLQLAGSLRRLGSLCYEAVLVVPVLFISAYLFLTLTQSLERQFLRPLLQLWLVGILGIYFMYCWTRGQTLAMKTWHIRLGLPDGSRVPLWRASVRFAVALVGVLLTGVGFFWAAVDREHQFLHDRVAGTRLFSTAKRNKRLRHVDPSSGALNAESAE